MSAAHSGARPATIERVLLIDDEEDLRTLATMSLRRVGGWAVVAAPSGPEGIAEARRAPPDLILIDVMMPGCDGPMTLRMLRDDPVTASIPIIFVTAKAQRRELDELLQLGAQGVIVKPFDPMLLPDQIRRIFFEEPRTK